MRYAKGRKPPGRDNLPAYPRGKPEGEWSESDRFVVALGRRGRPLESYTDDELQAIWDQEMEGKVT